MADFVIKIHQKLTNFEYKNGHISKTNWKIDFSFVSAHSTSFMEIWHLLKKQKLPVDIPIWLKKNWWAAPLTNGAAPLDPACFRIEGPSLIALHQRHISQKKSLQCFACMREVTCIKIKINKNFERGQIYMEDSKCANT